MAALANIANCSKPPEIAKTKINPVKQKTDQCGVANFGCTLPRNFGNKPSLDPANKTRGVFKTSVLTAPKHEIAAANNKIVPPIGPIIFSATAANGASLTAPISAPNTPCVTV